MIKKILMIVLTIAIIAIVFGTVMGIDTILSIFR